MKKLSTFFKLMIIFFLLVVGNESLKAQYVTNGNAYNAGGTTYQLTSNGAWQNGSVWYQNYMTLNADFDITAQLYLGTNHTNTGADGIAFVMQPLSTGLGSVGGGMGYQGISPSVEVEFDTYLNPNDPNNNHISIQTNGNTNTNSGSKGGFTPGGYLADGNWHTARFTWNHSSHTLAVYWDGVQRITYTNDLVSTYFSGNPKVYWGFTAATGLAYNLQKVTIQSASFCASTAINSQSTGAQTVCYGSSFSPISVTAIGTNLYYQWYSMTSPYGSGTSLGSANGAQTSTYYPQASTAGTLYYYCVVHGCDNVYKTSSTSGAFTVVPVSVGGTISGTTPILYGASSGTMTLSGYTGSIIRWEKQLNSTSGTWTTISNTSATYSEFPTSSGTWYYRAYIQNGICSGVYSSTFALTVNPNSNAYAINGNAYANGGNCFTLTPNTGWQAGSVWYPHKMSLAYDFDITLNVYLGSSDGGADGIAFVLQPLATNLGASGGGLGYAGITPSIAVEYDTYQNSSDPSADHVSIQPNGNTDNNYTLGYYTLSNIEDGNWHSTRVTWDHTNKNFKVYWAGTQIISITNDFVANYFSGNPNVYWGMTGGTGAAYNLQQFCTTSYSFQESIFNTFSQTNVNCYGGSTGSATASLISGVGGTFDGWYQGNTLITTNLTATGLSAGTYTAKAHTSTASQEYAVTITQAAAITFTTSVTNPACSSGCTGTITVSASGGNGTYTYSKDNGSNYQSSNTFTTLSPGTYNIIVKDGNNCMSDPQAVTVQSYLPIGLTATSGGTVSSVNQAAYVATDATITGSTPVDGANVQITNYITGQDQLGIDGNTSGTTLGITYSFNATTGILALTGSTTAANYQTVLRLITYKNLSNSPNNTTRNIAISLGTARFDYQNGHFYQFISGNYTNPQAQSDAASRYYYGRQGYLVTVTSAFETAVINSILIGDAWMGASDATVGVWKWISGTESGTQFSQYSTPFNGAYTNWASNQPDAYSSGFCAHFWASYSYQWDDAPASSIDNYIIEFGGMANDPSSSLSATVNVTVPYSASCSGNALAFDGGADWVNLPAINLNSSNFTVEGWINWGALNYAGQNANSNWERFFDFGNGTASNNILVARPPNSQNLQFDVYYGATGQSLSVSNVITTGQYMHIAAVANGGTTYLYINGVLAGSKTGVTVNNINRTLCYLGHSNWSGENTFTGLMDEVSIWNVARTQVQIQSDMVNPLAGSETGLLAYYNFDQGVAGGDNTTITTLYDKTGNYNGSNIASFLRYNANNTSNFTTSILGIPVLAATTATNVMKYTANINCNITSVGWGGYPTVRGVCYNTLTAPNITNNSIVYDVGSFPIGPFTKTLTGLSPGQTYYARAYATNGCTTTYGTEVSFTTTMPTCPVNAGPDIQALSGQLNASGADLYSWTPTAGLSNPRIANPTVTVGGLTTYSVTGYTESGNNLITNGDFESGNTGFTSAYGFVDCLDGQCLYPEGKYTVGKNPTTYHDLFPSCTDHTSGSGKMMIINGSGTTNTNIWCQTVTVQTGTDYAFSAWVTPVSSVSPPILQFSINGINLGSPDISPATTCDWHEFYQTWNSGLVTSANICVVNQNTAVFGNDFALDDITFKQFCTDQDMVDVGTAPCATPTIDNPGTQTQCINGVFTPMTVTATGTNITYQWYSNTVPATNTGTSLGSDNGAQSYSYTPLAA
ncbi:MAG: LamG-like jellyroll fold domain-containing protein, partial [Bacteroidota bacterium]